MTLVLSQPALTEPVDLMKLKAHLRLDHNREDDLLNSLITAAREYLEQRTELALITQNWRLCLDEWPLDKCIYLKKTPVQSIHRIIQYDANGVEVTIDSTNMVLDGKSRPARLYTHHQSPPDRLINGIEIIFTAGFGEAVDVPDLLKQTILLHASHMYEFRAVVSPQMQPASIPVGYDKLISSWLRKSI